MKTLKEHPWATLIMALLIMTFAYVCVNELLQASANECEKAFTEWARTCWN